jgi:hypothetical protein
MNPGGCGSATGVPDGTGESMSGGGSGGSGAGVGDGTGEGMSPGGSGGSVGGMVGVGVFDGTGEGMTGGGGGGNSSEGFGGLLRKLISPALIPLVLMLPVLILPSE